MICSANITRSSVTILYYSSLPTLRHRTFVHIRVHVSTNGGVRKFPASVQLIIISRFILNLRRSDQDQRTVPSNPSQVPTLGSFLNDMGNLLNQGSDDAEGPREGPPSNAMAAGPSGTHRQDDDADAHPDFDAIQLGTVDKGDGTVRVPSQSLMYEAPPVDR